MLVALISVDSVSLEARGGDMSDMSLRESLRVMIEDAAGAIRMLEVGVGEERVGARGATSGTISDSGIAAGIAAG